MFQGKDTRAFPVENLAELEEEGLGVVHHHFLLEARVDESVLTGQVMLAATRALPQLAPGAYALTEILLSAMWGGKVEQAGRDWL